MSLSDKIHSVNDTYALFLRDRDVKEFIKELKESLITTTGQDYKLWKEITFIIDKLAGEKLI